MRVIFMGTPAFAVPALDALVGAGHRVIAAYTQPPRPAGRGKTVQPSPVQRRAEALGIPVRSPPTLKTAAEQADFAGLSADVAVVAAYGLILPLPILEAPRLGCINIHASLLPRWRGAAPIQRAVLAGDAQTGVTIMQMEAGLDTGPMLLAEATPIAAKTAGELTEELARLGAALLLRALDERPLPVPQPDQGVTLAAKIAKAEAHLDCSRPAAELERAVRAFNPTPGAYVVLAGERLKILSVEVVAGTFSPGVLADDRLGIGTADGLLRPLTVQRAGKPAMRVDDLLNGWRLPAGTPVL